MTAELNSIAVETISYLEEQVMQMLPSLPADIADAIALYGVYPMLLQTYDWTRPFMRQEFVDELDGMAAGSGVPVEKLRAFNMFPELTKAACTIIGATGPATENKFLSQLRALDIGPDIPTKDQAQVTIYHNSDSSTNTFLTVGWTGMIGSLTGFSANGIGIGEKLWINPNAKADESVNGEPWMFVLRNVLEYTSTTAEAIASIQNANRTCSIHVGIGSAADNDFSGLLIAAKYFDVPSASSMVWPGHPYYPGVLYWDSHKQPSQNPCLSDLLQQNYGAITAEMMALQIAPLAQTGEFHCVTFDYEAKYAFIANSRKTYDTEGSDNAYMRQFTRVDMGKLFSEPSL
eukprot:GILI01005486.1.p1 GENE.GILI01005486.1~~GILI01005486.1.p1  ORF type:complete len:346 (+),score=79.60 GILI01005486.1:142-1179(+)